MISRATSFLPTRRMSVPTWLALIAIVWTATMLGSASPQPSIQHGLLGWDSQDAVVTTDRGPSLHATDRRRCDDSSAGKPLPCVPALTAVDAVSSPRQRVDHFQRVDVSHRPHTLAQPRAPPANAAARAS